MYGAGGGGCVTVALQLRFTHSLNDSAQALQHVCPLGQPPSICNSQINLFYFVMLKNLIKKHKIIKKIFLVLFGELSNQPEHHVVEAREFHIDNQPIGALQREDYENWPCQYTVVFGVAEELADEHLEDPTAERHLEEEQHEDAHYMTHEYVPQSSVLQGSVVEGFGALDGNHQRHQKARRSPLVKVHILRYFEMRDQSQYRRRTSSLESQ